MFFLQHEKQVPRNPREVCRENGSIQMHSYFENEEIHMRSIPNKTLALKLRIAPSQNEYIEILQNQ